MSLPARNENGGIRARPDRSSGNVHDDAPSQASAHVGAVAHCSGEAEGRANDQRPCWDVRHRACREARTSGGFRAAWRLGDGGSGRLRIAGLPMWVATQGEGFTANPFRYKKRRQKRPRCVRDILCRLKKRRVLLACRLSYLVVEKTTAFDVCLASPSGFEPPLTA